MRVSQILTLPSSAVVAMRCPSVDGSTETDVRGDVWARSLTWACETEGDQSVTVPVDEEGEQGQQLQCVRTEGARSEDAPLLCPRWIMAECGFCAIVSTAPSLVRCSTRSWPVDVSWYLR